MWYDHVEEQLQEFTEVKESYDLLQHSVEDETAEKRQERAKQLLSNFDLKGKENYVVK
jgi:hypothetical protein